MLAVANDIWRPALFGGSLGYDFSSMAVALDFTTNDYWAGGTKRALSAMPGYAFTRSGTQGAYDKAGAVQWFGTNLLLQSQAFDAAPWAWLSQDGAILTPNYGLAPDGTMTADRLQQPSAGAWGHSCRTQGGIASTNTLLRVGSIWMRSLTGGNCEIDTDLTEPAVLNHHQQNIVTPVWQRFDNIQTFSSAASGNTFGVGMGINGLPFDVLIWQAQVEAGGTASAPIPTTTAAADAPAINSRGFHSYPAVTNSILQSQAFDDAVWAKNGVTVAANTVAALDGTMTADTLNDGIANSPHYLPQGNYALTLSNPLTVSVFAKAGANAGRYLQICEDHSSPGTAGVNFDLVGGAVTRQPGGNVAAYITPIANGWFRCVLTGVVEVASSSTYAITADTPTAGRAPSYTGANNTIHLWQAQTLNANYPDGGPLIATAGASASLGPSVLNVSPPADVTADHDFYALVVGTVSDSVAYMLMVRNAATSQYFALYASNGFRFASSDGTAIASDVFTPGRWAMLMCRRAGKWVCGYKRPNGVIVAPPTVADVASTWATGGVDRIDLGHYVGGSQFGGQLERVLWKNATLTNADITALLTQAGGPIQLGPELVGDPGFDNPGYWLTNTGWSVAGSKAVGAAATGYLYRAGAPIVAGKGYQWSFDVVSATAGSARAYVGATAVYGPSVSAVGHYSGQFAATSGSEMGLNSLDGFTGTIDNFSIKETTW